MGAKYELQSVPKPTRESEATQSVTLQVKQSTPVLMYVTIEWGRN